MKKLGLDDFEEFSTGFVAALLVTTKRADGKPVADGFSRDDVATHTAMVIAASCILFLDKCDVDEEDFIGVLHGSLASRVGCDFAVTANSEATGFWDGDYDEAVGDRLTKLARSMGPFDLHVGDDGKLYLRK